MERASIHGESDPIHGKEASIHGESDPIHGKEASIHGESNPIHGKGLNPRRNQFNPRKGTSPPIAK
jgi:hypothetical protein